MLTAPGKHSCGHPEWQVQMRLNFVSLAQCHIDNMERFEPESALHVRYGSAVGKTQGLAVKPDSGAPFIMINIHRRTRLEERISELNEVRLMRYAPGYGERIYKTDPYGLGHPHSADSDRTDCCCCACKSRKKNEVHWHTSCHVRSPH